MNSDHIKYWIRIRLMLIFGVLLVELVPMHGQKSQAGLASYYHDSLEDNKTASGEIFHQNKFTAAHKTLAFDTWVLIKDSHGNDAVVRINDRLPAKSTRMIDLTSRAAKEMKMMDKGVKRVVLQVITAREAWVWFVANGYLRLDVMWR